MKATEQYFSVGLFVMLYKTALTLNLSYRDDLSEK